MTEPDEALLYARLRAKGRMSSPNNPHRDISAEIDAGKYDDELADEAEAYRAGEMAEALRAQALVDFAVAMEEHDDNEVCDAAWDALDTYWGRP
jgi:hypothetical protein